jgi:PAT family beta-lactamase induction signal transducer AmpG
MLGGAIIARVGLRRALMPITLAMAITEPLYVWMAAAPGTFGVSVPGTATSAADLDLLAVLPAIVGIGTIIVIEQVCGGMAVAAQVVFIMRRADPEHRAAHFAFATAIYSTAQMLVGGSSGWAYEQIGPVPYFVAVSLLTLPAVALAAIVPTHSRSDPDALA